MSKLSLMIFTFIVLAIILCHHSACSQRVPGNVHNQLRKCPSCPRKRLIKPEGKHWKCKEGNRECFCWKAPNDLIRRHCAQHNFYNVPTPI